MNKSGRFKVHFYFSRIFMNEKIAAIIINSRDDQSMVSADTKIHSKDKIMCIYNSFILFLFLELTEEQNQM